MHLNEMIFAINTTASSEGTGSPADRFFGRSLRTRLPNSVNPEIKSDELIKRRITKHDARIKNKNKRNKILYKIGERVRLQNVATRDWDLKGTIERVRTADDGRVVSYDVLTDKEYMTTRHRRYLKRLHKDHDPKIINDKQSGVIKNADLQNIESVTPPGSRQRRSSRLRGALSRSRTVKSVKLLEMGAEQSTPLSVEVKLEVDNGTITLKEVNTSEGKACEEHCECNGRKRSAKDRKSKRAQALNGSYNRKSNGNSSRSSSSSDGRKETCRAGRIGRRKTDASV